MKAALVTEEGSRAGIMPTPPKRNAALTRSHHSAAIIFFREVVGYTTECHTLNTVYIEGRVYELKSP